MNAVGAEIISFDPAELAEREGRIERAQRNAYFEIGLELAAIRDRKLYRREFETFENYVAQRWEWERQTAYRLIAAAECAHKVLSPIGVIPAKESHIREACLMLVPPGSAADRPTVHM